MHALAACPFHSLRFFWRSQCTALEGPAASWTLSRGGATIRAALESVRASAGVHLWIDLTFGHQLAGPAAVAAKNVALAPADPTLPRAAGRAQLFARPHPPRRPPPGGPGFRAGGCSPGKPSSRPQHCATSSAEIAQPAGEVGTAELSVGGHALHGHGEVGGNGGAWSLQPAMSSLSSVNLSNDCCAAAEGLWAEPGSLPARACLRLLEDYERRYAAAQPPAGPGHRHDPADPPPAHARHGRSPPHPGTGPGRDAEPRQGLFWDQGMDWSGETPLHQPRHWEGRAHPPAPPSPCPYAADVAAFGRLVVQLEERALLLAPPAADLRAWRARAARLPAAAAALAAACLAPEHALAPSRARRPTAALLLRADYFPPHVREAAAFLGRSACGPSTVGNVRESTEGTPGPGDLAGDSARPGASDGGSRGTAAEASHVERGGALAGGAEDVVTWALALAAAAKTGLLARLSPGAQRLCLPAVLKTLEVLGRRGETPTLDRAISPAEVDEWARGGWRSADGEEDPGLQAGSHSGFHALLLVALACPDRGAIRARVLPLVGRLIAAGCGGGVPESRAAAALLQPPALRALVDADGAQPFFDSIMPVLLDALCCAAPRLSQAACEARPTKLPFCCKLLLILFATPWRHAKPKYLLFASVRECVATLWRHTQPQHLLVASVRSSLTSR